MYFIEAVRPRYPPLDLEARTGIKARRSSFMSDICGYLPNLALCKVKFLSRDV